MCLRQILVLAHTVAEAHAEDSARADRRERLHHLIARIARIRPRVKPDINTLHAIGLQRPDRKCQTKGDRHDPEPEQRADKEDKCHEERHTEHNARRTKVRLAIDKECHHENCPERDRNLASIPLHAKMLLAEHRRDRKRPHEHRHQLCKLRGLKAQWAEREPSLRPIYRRSNKEHSNQ